MPPRESRTGFHSWRERGFRIGEVERAVDGGLQLVLLDSAPGHDISTPGDNLIVNRLHPALATVEKLVSVVAYFLSGDRVHYDGHHPLEAGAIREPQFGDAIHLG